MEKKHIKRRLFSGLKSHLTSKEISIIVGPRQAGKTTLMKELVLHVQQMGGKTVFLNLDYEADKVYVETQDALINKLRLEFGSGPGYAFIDEIQRKKNAGLFLKGIYDMELPYKLIVSGSGSLELKESIHESLAGRKRLFELHTVDFFEFTDFRTGYEYSDRLHEFFAVEKNKTETLLKEYLDFGGYPRVVLADTAGEKSLVLGEIFSSVIERDITGFLNINRPDAFSSMIKILASQTGRLLRYSELAKQVGISMPVIKKYLWYAEKTFLIALVPPFFSNKQKEILKSPVPYFCDIGMRNFSLGLLPSASSHADAGFIFQNLIANMLQSALTPIHTLHFWRTTAGAEVDFIVSGPTGVIPVEVKYSDMRSVEITRSLRSFIEKYHPQKALVANKSFSGSHALLGTQVIAAPFYDCVRFLSP